MILAMRLLGAFYLVGGVFALASLTRGRWIDAGLEALSGGTQPRHRLRYALLALGAALTATCGLALLALHRAALWLMIANVAAQLVWLAYAARAFAPEDADDALGRARTVRAAILFSAATAFVAWVAINDAAAFDAGAEIGAALVAVLAGGLLYAAWGWRQGKPSPRDERDDEDGGAAFDLPEARQPAAEPRPSGEGPRALLLAPRKGGAALWDADGAPWEPEELGLSPDLIDRIRCLEMDVIEAQDDSSAGAGLDPGAHARLAAEAEAITQGLAAIYGEGNVRWRLPPRREQG